MTFLVCDRITEIETNRCFVVFRSGARLYYVVPSVKVTAQKGNENA